MRNKYGSIVGALRNTNLFILAMSLAAFLCAIAFASVRLRMIIESQDLSIKFYEVLSLTFIGYFFNNFLPTTIGGDVVKGYYLSKRSSQPLVSFASVFVDRAIGLLTMVFMAFIVLTFAGNRIAGNVIKPIIYAMTACSLLLILFVANRSVARFFSFFLFFIRPFEDRLKRIYGAISGYRHHKALIVQSFLISVMSQILFFICLWVIALSIKSRIPFVELLLRMPIISILSLLPSINGLGLREGATVIFFGPIIGRENAFVVSILWLFILFVTSLVGGLVYALSPQFKVKVKEIEKREVLL